MSDYLSSSKVTAAFLRVASSGVRAADMSTVELAAMGVWHGAAPDMSEVSGPYLEDAFDLLERLSFYSIVPVARKRDLLGQVKAHRKTQRLGGSAAFEEAFHEYLPCLQPLQTRHFVAELRKRANR